ncbi:MAG: phosphatidylserine decarboxylase-domain-containing protein [Linnemannia gamsii]|nr:MAG: phosphatidylserine decarboxylase-domain-containing protein [Linnemannia gamsii]
MLGRKEFSNDTPLGSAQGQQPFDDESLSARMRICISKATNLAVKDMNGFSDPYVKVSIGGHKFTTKVVPKSLNPVWNATFEFDLEAFSVPDQVSLVFWDKDFIGKDDFMGIVNIPFDESSIWSDSTPKHFDDPHNQSQWHTLKTKPGKSSNVSGEVEIKFGFIDTALAPVYSNSRAECQRIWSALLSGRNKLGLGQRVIHNADNTTIAMSDIPMAVSDNGSSVNVPQEAVLNGTNGSLSHTLHGVVFMEIVSAVGLPKLHNMTRTGFDMDPFVIISFGKYIFRTRVVRHNLNPVWNAKLMFRVHNGEDAFKIKYSIHDWDKLSGNDHVGVAIMPINDLIQAASEREEGPVPAEGEFKLVDPEMKEYVLKIDLTSKADNIKATAEDESRIRVRAKFVSYRNLRRRFWLGLAKAYDAVDNVNDGQFSKVQIQTMLEGLGSTLSGKTIDSFFEHVNKDPEMHELTFDELFDQLEQQVKVDDGGYGQEVSAPRKKFFGRSRASINSLSDLKTGADQQAEEKEIKEAFEESVKLAHNQVDPGSHPQAIDIIEPTDADFDTPSSEGEHLVRISTCPICHDPSLGTKLETDIITHIAVCSGNDGFNLDKLILGDFVTEANAQRKWITKVVKSLGYGRYVVGRSNANIIVQDRATGIMLEEKMPTFIRLGIRLLYRSPAQKIHVGKILANMSFKQGRKFDDPRSKRDIEPFIQFHRLESQMQEVLEPIHNFKNFNEFFYRKLKADARVLASPGDDRVAVSVADCRMTCWPTISDATKFWIKGHQFTVGRLIGDNELAKKYEGGALAIFRLAPQDYHRYHIPVKGVLSEPKLIAGEYYTVNPMAIRSQLDVYGENKRVVSTIQSPEFGTVAYVAIGAMMVGSIVLTTQGGQSVERMDEHGYFAFGGSTIVVLFEPGAIVFDEDLVRSSKEQIEMLVKVGMRIGVCPR